MLRVIVKDTNDIDEGDAAEMYLDSDGDVAITLKDQAGDIPDNAHQPLWL